MLTSLSLLCLQSLPFAYVLMTNKNRPSYDASLAHIKARFRELHPEANMEQIKLVISDFEAAILGSMGAAFPWTRPRGCWFHYAQAIFRRALKYGLQVEYKKKCVVFLIVKQLTSSSASRGSSRRIQCNFSGSYFHF